ncbi:hypothetical protein K450DRAFT_256982, partial [Umbelopsis ramanniana AG]
IAHLYASTSYVDSNSPCDIYALSSIRLLPWIADWSIWCKRYSKMHAIRFYDKNTQRDTAVVTSNNRKVDGRLVYDVNGRLSTLTEHLTNTMCNVMGCVA